MALTLGFTDARTGTPVPAAYLRVQEALNLDMLRRVLRINLVVYWDAAARSAGLQPIGAVPVDLSGAYAQIVEAAPTAQEVGVENLLAARTYGVLKTQSSVTSPDGNVFDLTKATDA